VLQADYAEWSLRHSSVNLFFEGWQNQQQQQLRAWPIVIEEAPDQTGMR